ncbi:IclR family transcriptional regulator [Kocuria sp.]|uniref:IclR family transcriptional regulator n=1 Tax=Kocuria sp. TaxID=1871328 RepID=UPI0026DF29DF|nr:IclR family transcriptional regulator [Kocuria sp.]MDO5618883.1 IclR family transcriptional regulator [Kocuria sp.]
MTEKQDQTTIQSVDRAARILEILGEEAPLSISEIARRLGVHRSTALRLLATLETHNLVEQVAARGSYQLGFALLHLANSVTHRIDFARDAQICCDTVAAHLNETVNVAVMDEGYAMTITQTTGNRMVGLTRQYVGQRGPLHATSTGKMLLAHADPSALEQLLERGLEGFTSMTITDPEVLRSELEALRERDWASSVAEWEEGINALAVPVRNADGRVVAALAVNAPAFRLPESSFADVAEVLHHHTPFLESRLSLETSVAGSPRAMLPAH